jgi:hypothetical protein
MRMFKIGMLLIMLTSMMSACADDKKREIALYQSVKAENILDQSGQQVKSMNLGESPKFIVENGELYLLIQTTHKKWWLVTAVQHEPWNPERIAMLRQEHREFEQMLPNPTAPNGGIKWIATHRN